eukprot:CAMPEP_0204149056 /NCGR_PEP_ID=MMETSP0361-20130328/24084_1 /ASSEMBLY_ACC=CAM_ASM_000343 /TAXON_ID=268821 /ORGANISM="Scrippsiella Hangoei, Strain SHTV-5" /LENGTH=44 /DNA_ID= /DNA_START= /DNA_END= /DNA_ORIENTATION=
MAQNMQEQQPCCDRNEPAVASTKKQPRLQVERPDNRSAPMCACA